MNTLKKSSVIIMLLALFTQVTKAQQWDGLTLYSNMNTAVGYLLDTNSNVVKTWNFTGNTGYSTHMMPGGTLVRTVMNQGNILMGGGVSGRIQKVDYGGTILWDYTYSSSTYVIHHDHCPLPNGNILVISYDVKTGTDVTAAGGTLNATVWSEKIMELQPVGANSANVVWEWKLWDHLVQDKDPLKPNYQSSIVNNPQLMNVNYALAKDWVHMNGVDYNPVLDQIVLSSHMLNEWYVIDHSTTTAQAASHAGGNAGKGGDFLYRWGNPAAYNASGTKVLNVTHDAHWIPDNCPNGGNLAGINNRGSVTTTTKTTADQAIIPRSGFNYTISPGSAYSPAAYSARKVGSGYTTNMGSAQEFPNGNHLICLATVGVLQEVDAAGNTLWTKSTAGSTPQSHRYSSCYINNPAPPQPSISVVSNTLLTSTSASSYQWYKNGDPVSGAISQTYAPAQPGIYTVKTTDNNGCVDVYASAFSYTYTGPPPPPVDETGISENSLYASLLIFPNPSDGNFTIDFQKEMTDCTIRISDNTGKMVFEVSNQKEINLSEFPAGLYFLNLTIVSGESVNKKITIIK
jgi:hypothetical protein